MYALVRFRQVAEQGVPKKQPKGRLIQARVLLISVDWPSSREMRLKAV